MSFILDIPLLVLLGYISVYLNQKHLHRRSPDSLFLLGAAIMALFLGVSIPLYLNWLPPPNLEPLPLFGPCGDGATFMWNSCLGLGITPTRGLHPIALLLFLSYPLGYLWGVERGRWAFGRRPGQGGIRWMFQMRSEEDFGAHRKY
ncbi:MAG: hypothetical protein HY558_01840 [Euryarchaeota archaeon]|nr:hypothetical protein [Euryarchaeota archaeon]